MILLSFRARKKNLPTYAEDAYSSASLFFLSHHTMRLSVFLDMPSGNRGLIRLSTSLPQRGFVVQTPLVTREASVATEVDYRPPRHTTFVWVHIAVAAYHPQLSAPRTISHRIYVPRGICIAESSTSLLFWSGCQRFHVFSRCE